MKRTLLLVAASGALVSAVPATAAQGQTGCQLYGQVLAGAFHANVPGGQLVAAVAATGPGAVADFSSNLRAQTCS
jgi:hypothetical protein